jgi:inward rectifier potassium channel
MIKSKNNSKAETELGFGTKSYKNEVRFLNNDGTVNVLRKSNHFFEIFDVFNWMITTKTINILMVMLSAFFLTNILFATLYYWIGGHSVGGIVSPEGGLRFWDLFFFSAQTLTTVGYGHMHPIGILSSAIAAFESMIGLLVFALATGVVYGRFSRVKAEILYSNKALISPYKDSKAVMFRIANKKNYELIEVSAKIVYSYMSKETNKRHFVNLKLEIENINFLALSWTIVHPLDEDSPMHNMSLENIKDLDGEFLVLIKATNETNNQIVYSRTSFKHHDMIENVKFVPINQVIDRQNRVTIDLNEIHSYIQV